MNPQTTLKLPTTPRAVIITTQDGANAVGESSANPLYVNVVNGGSGSMYTVVTKIATYTANTYEDVWCTGTFTVTSPAPGNQVRFKVANQGTGQITVAFASGTFMGDSSLVLGVMGAVELSSDGTNWQAE